MVVISRAGGPVPAEGRFRVRKWPWPALQERLRAWVAERRRQRRFERFKKARAFSRRWLLLWNSAHSVEPEDRSRLAASSAGVLSRVYRESCRAIVEVSSFSERSFYPPRQILSVMRRICWDIRCRQTTFWLALIRSSAPTRRNGVGFFGELPFAICVRHGRSLDFPRSASAWKSCCRLTSIALVILDATKKLGIRSSLPVSLLPDKFSPILCGYLLTWVALSVANHWRTADLRMSSWRKPCSSRSRR